MGMLASSCVILNEHKQQRSHKHSLSLRKATSSPTTQHPNASHLTQALAHTHTHAHAVLTARITRSPNPHPLRIHILSTLHIRDRILNVALLLCGNELITDLAGVGVGFADAAEVEDQAGDG